MEPVRGEAAGWVRSGATALGARAPEVTALCERVGAPVTVRPVWLQAWADSYPGYQPLLIGVDGANGRPSGIAPLARKPHRFVDDVVMWGHGPTDTTTFPIADADAGARLVDAVVTRLERLGRPWRLLLRHLDADDVVGVKLVDALPGGRSAEGDVAPQLVASAGRELRDYVSASHRRGISRIRNRIVNAGLRPEVRHLGSPAEAMAVLPQMEEIHRARDIELGRRGGLDDAAYAAFFRRLILDHAAVGQLCLTTLSLDDRLAAYVVCFVEGDVFRMWNCRFDPERGRFSPGKLAMEESVAHALAHGCSAYDFMRGAEPYKFSYANHLPRTVDVVAASNPVLGVPLAAVAAARPRIRALREGDGRATRAVRAVDTLRSRRWGR